MQVTSQLRPVISQEKRPADYVLAGDCILTGLGTREFIQET